MVKILVVEDERIVAMDLMSRLRNLGYEVPGSASSGEEAIEKAVRWRPDLVLMDIYLNGEMDGIQAAVRIKSRFNIPVIYLTAYADPGTLQRAKVTEPFGYVLKPFEERELLTTIEMALYKYRIEQRLKDSERWLATTLKSIGDGVVATDQDGRVKFMNPVAENLTGWKQGEALGKSLTEVFRLVSVDAKQPLDNPLNRVLMQGTVTGLSTSAILVSRDGRETPVYDSAAPIKDDDGTVTGVVLIFSDITERKRAEEALRESQRFQSTLISNLPGMVYRCRNDSGWTMEYVSEGCARLTGYESTDLMHNHMISYNDLIHPEDREYVRSTIARALGYKMPFQITYRIRTRQGAYRWVWEQGRLAVQGNPEVLEGFIIDINERKRAEEALHRKNRELEIVGSITSSINRARGMEEMLDYILHDSLELLEMDAGAIYICEQEGMRYAQLAAVAARTDAGRTVRYRQVLHDVSQDPDTIRPGDPAVVIFEGAKAAATVPITVREGLIGIMAFYSAAGISIGNERSATLLGIGAQIGIAVENQRLFKNIQDTSQYLADVINESPDAILTVDPGGFIISFNKSASRLLKYDAEEVRGRHMTSLLPDNAELDLAENKNYVREFRCKDGTVITLNISTATLFREGRKSGFIITLKDLSEIAGLKIVPIMEKAVDTAQRYHFEPGAMYLFDKRKSSQSWEVFADQVKHNIPGLCITRQNPKRIREQYGLEKTPIIWLTGSEGISGEISMKPDNLTGLGATVGKFLAQTKGGLILLDGIEYLMTRNGYEAVLKLVHFLNDKVMSSDCMVLCSIDPLTMEERQYRILLTEMREYDE
jgi:PAS domain S-box/PAS domain S-box/PAS domain S-box